MTWYRNEETRTAKRDDNSFQVFSLTKPDAEVRDYKKRRSHTKTHSGCLACRLKRVKCDELKPICARCTRNNRCCRYQTSSFDTFVKVDLPLAGQIWDDTSSPASGTSRTHLMYHAIQNWTTILDIPGREEVLRLCQSCPLLRSVVLAISASHLRHTSEMTIRHKIAEHFQLYVALQEYRYMLSRPVSELDQETVNLLLLSTVLLNLLAFAMPGDADCDVYSSWVFSAHENRLGWLTLQEGSRHVFRSSEEHLGSAMTYLGDIFLGPDQDPWVYSSIHRGTSVVPVDWLTFFLSKPAETKQWVHLSDIREEKQQEAIMPALITLSQAMRIQPVSSNVFHNLSFLRKVNAGFRTLLHGRDEKALWLIGYWFGTMCRYEDLWWCRDRARRDYEAVREWLLLSCVSKRPGIEGETWQRRIEELERAPIRPQA